MYDRYIYTNWWAHPHPTNAKSLLTSDGHTRELALGGIERLKKKRTKKADGAIEYVDKGVTGGARGENGNDANANAVEHKPK